MRPVISPETSKAQSSSGTAATYRKNRAHPEKSQSTSHQNIHRSEKKYEYPNERHADKEKRKNIHDQSNLKEIEQIDGQVKRCKRNFKRAVRRNDSAAKERYQQKIQELKTRKTDLSTNLKKDKSYTHAKTSKQRSEKRSSLSSSDDLTSQLKNLNKKIEDLNAELSALTANGSEKQAENIENQLESLRQQRLSLLADMDSEIEDVSESSDASGISHSDATALKEVSGSLASDPIEPMKKRLHERQIELKYAKTKLITNTRRGAGQESIRKIENEIKELQRDISKLEKVVDIAEQKSTSNSSENSIEPDGTMHTKRSDHRSLAGALRNTKAKQHTKPQKEPPQSPSSSATPLKKLNDANNRNSALLSRDDLKQYFSDEGKKTLEKLDAKIDALSDTIDQKIAERDYLKLIKNSKETQNIEKYSADKIKKIDSEIRELVIKLGRLITKVSTLEDMVLPAKERLSAEDKKNKYEALIKSYKSEKTLQLDGIYKSKLARYESEVFSSRGTEALSMFGGAATNFFTFFVGNSLTRAMAKSAPDAAAYVGGAVSGFLHIVVGAPVLKQVIASSWNAPALVEFNNYWKLVGASWGDWWRGEQDIEKYGSKYADKLELLTIKQRLAEERPFWNQFFDRYKTEEAAYYSYSMNFTFKAIFAGGFYSLMASKSDASRVIEWLVHGVMGWISGAETVAGIQMARSTVPGAKENVVPSREINGAHTEALESLLSDLERAYKNQKVNNSGGAEENDARDLLKAIRRTKKTLSEVRTKSHVGGTFWFEFISQFKSADARADVAAEVLGRALSVMPAAVLSNFLASWRTSGNPWLTFAGHALPALLLIAPPGWTLRPIYTGFFRALIQAAINGSSPKVGTASPMGTSISVPNELHDSIVEGPDSSGSSSYPSDELPTRKANAESEDSVVGPITDSDLEADGDTESDDENNWGGNPTARDAAKDW